jgi:very-short-patch-repair endonuclease
LQLLIPARDRVERRRLGRVSTPAEEQLWKRLRKRARRLGIRRRHPLGPFIVHFYCRAARLVVQLEGAEEPSPSREQWLRKQGFRIMRVAAAEAVRDPDSVARAILLAARSGSTVDELACAAE